MHKFNPALNSLSLQSGKLLSTAVSFKLCSGMWASMSQPKMTAMCCTVSNLWSKCCPLTARSLVEILASDSFGLLIFFGANAYLEHGCDVIIVSKKIAMRYHWEKFIALAQCQFWTLWATSTELNKFMITNFDFEGIKLTPNVAVLYIWWFRKQKWNIKPLTPLSQI